MTDKVKMVMRGFTQLSSAEQSDFIRELNAYLNEGYLQKGLISESLSNEVRRVLGPTSSAICPSCGR
jgi:hypothetical protein